MKKHILFTFLAFYFNFNYAQDLATNLKTIDQFLTSEYPKNEPGAVVLISKKGNVLFKKAYGLSSIKPKHTLKTDMVFQIGSMSKQFVSAAILQLIEAGKMSLDDSIQQYVPYYPSKKHTITIHHLLSQTSGIPEFFDVDDNEFYLLAKEHTPEQLINYYKNEPLLFLPGEQWQYSNSNYPLLGAALEKVTGTTLKEYLQTNIFDPLDMKSSGLWYRHTTAAKQIAKGYDNKNGEFHLGPKITGSVLYAPGGIVSTVNDLFLWNEALRNTRHISPFVVSQLTTEKTTNTGKATGYGYGFFMKDVQGLPTVQHGGNLYGFTSYGMQLPSEDLFVCVLANTKHDRSEMVAKYITSVLINKPIDIMSKNEIPIEKLKEYIGVYELQDEKLERIFEVKLFDNLMILSDRKAINNDAILTATGADVFIWEAANLTFKFKRNQDGIVNGFMVKQDKEYTFKKRI